jgi:hypothetical protein
MHIKTMTPNHARTISAPHGGADSASNRASAGTNDRAGRSCDQKASGAPEPRAGQNRTAADRQRGEHSEDQFHGRFPHGETIGRNL